MIHSSCGELWQFIDVDLTENGLEFCQGCGKSFLLAVTPVVG